MIKHFFDGRLVNTDKLSKELINSVFNELETTKLTNFNEFSNYNTSKDEKTVKIFEYFNSIYLDNVNDTSPDLIKYYLEKAINAIKNASSAEKFALVFRLVSIPLTYYNKSDYYSLISNYLKNKPPRDVKAYKKLFLEFEKEALNKLLSFKNDTANFNRDFLKVVFSFFVEDNRDLTSCIHDKCTINGEIQYDILKNTVFVYKTSVNLLTERKTIFSEYESKKKEVLLSFIEDVSRFFIQIKNDDDYIKKRKEITSYVYTKSISVTIFSNEYWMTYAELFFDKISELCEKIDVNDWGKLLMFCDIIKFPVHDYLIKIKELFNSRYAEMKKNKEVYDQGIIETAREIEFIREVVKNKLKSMNINFLLLKNSVIEVVKDIIFMFELDLKINEGNITDTINKIITYLDIDSYDYFSKLKIKQ